MSYHIEHHESAGEGVRRIAHEQLSKIIDTLGDKQEDPETKTHEIRKRCKKMRGLVRLMRPADKKLYKRENGFFRETAHEFSDLRDADVMGETYDLLMDRFDDEVDRPSLSSVRQALTQRRHRMAEQLDDSLHAKHQQAAEQFEAARARVDQWPDIDMQDVEDGVGRTYKRGVKALDDVEDDPTNENLHELRKRAKYHRYHIRLMQNAWKRPMKARRKEVKQLTELLGQHNDLAVFHELINDPDNDVIKHDDQRLVLNALIERLQAELSDDAIELAGCVFADKPKVLTHRWAEYWAVHHADAA